MNQENLILGIDIGGSGIKGNIVDITNGNLLYERIRIDTPENSKPEEIAKVIKQIADSFNYNGIIGCGFPAVVKNGIIKTAANINKANIDINANELFSKISERNVKVFNDADSAGIAEVKFGEGQSLNGTILVLTVGTGIGSALFLNGKLIPNTEFGHLFMKNGLIAEKFASDFIRKKEDLDWDKWGERFNEYLQYVELLFSPNLIIIGGGISKKYDKFINKIKISTKIAPAKLKNEAGIIGAAILSKENI